MLLRSVTYLAFVGSVTYLRWLASGGERPPMLQTGRAAAAVSPSPTALQLKCSAVQLHSTAAALPASWCLQLAVHHSTPWPAIWCNPTSSSSILAVELSKLTASAFSCILVQWYFSKRWMRLFIGKQCLAQQVSNTATMRSFTKHRKNCETALWGKDKLYWKISFIERKALLNERLYWKKEVIERKALL